MQADFLHELTDKLDKKYPGTKERLTKVVDSSDFVASYDITDSRPMYYDGINNKFYINSEEMSKTNKNGEALYDAEYLTATNLLYASFPYSAKMQGLRMGYSAGAAATACGNEGTIDPYEDLRQVTAELNSLIYADATCELCEAPNADVCAQLFEKHGLDYESASSFISMYDYLAMNGSNIDAVAKEEYVKGLINSLGRLKQKENTNVR